jgi:hypothetical protein
MPDVPSGFTHVPTIMVAERLSEKIASTYSGMSQSGNPSPKTASTPGHSGP